MSLTTHHARCDVVPNRRWISTLLRRAAAASAIVCIVAGSLTAQAVEARLAGGIAPPSAPAHHCTPKLCYVTPPRHVPGGWPDPFLPALLLGAGLIGAGLWLWLTHAAPTAASPRSDSHPDGRPAAAPDAPKRQALREVAARLRRRSPPARSDPLQHPS
jgi:hypothetical protein